MSGYLSLMIRELNILTVISIASLTGLTTKDTTIGTRKAEQKERPKLPHADFISIGPASRVEPSVLSEVLASSPRLASQGWIIFDDLWHSYLSIPLRGFCHKIDITFGGVSPAYHWGCTIKDHLWRSSSRLRSGEALVMMFLIRIGGLCSH